MSSKTTSVGCSLPRHSIMRRIARNTSRWFTTRDAGPEPEEQSDVASRVRALRSGDEPGDALVELVACDRRWVRVEDPERLSHDLGRSVVAGPLLVRQAAPTDQAASSAFDLRRDLAAEPRLPDAGRPDDGDQVRPRVERRLTPHGADQVELARPPDEPARAARAVRPAPRARASRATSRPGSPCPSRPTEEAPRRRLRFASPAGSRRRRPGCRPALRTAAGTPCSPRPRSRALLRRLACSR